MEQKVKTKILTSSAGIIDTQGNIIINHQSALYANKSLHTALNADSTGQEMWTRLKIINGDIIHVWIYHRVHLPKTYEILASYQHTSKEGVWDVQITPYNDYVEMIVGERVAVYQKHNNMFYEVPQGQSRLTEQQIKED